MVIDISFNTLWTRVYFLQQINIFTVAPTHIVLPSPFQRRQLTAQI
jgi:hypothetical protein